MPTLSSLAIGVLLALSVSSTALAYSGANTMPNLLQFDAGRDPATALGSSQGDHASSPASPRRVAQGQDPTGDSQTRKDDFQQYFDRHLRAQVLLNTTLQQATNAQ
jgi:hypothetical protein